MNKLNTFLVAVIAIVVVFAFTMSSCYDASFGDVNTNSKSNTTPDNDAILSSAQRELVDQVLNANVNRNPLRLTSQYWTQTTYTDESNFDFFTRNISDKIWEVLYVDVLYKLKLSTDGFARDTVSFNSSNQLSKLPATRNRIAIAEILNAYAYTTLVETYGDVPYKQASLGSENILPQYDDAKTVLKDLVIRIDKAVALLSESGGTIAGDILYKGNATNWKKFGNSLKLRIGMLFADVENAYAKSLIEQAYQGRCFENNNDNAVLVYTSSTPDTHPLWIDLVQSNRKDFVACDTFIRLMYNLDDPRMAIYFDTAVSGADTITQIPLKINKYLGQKAGQSASASSYSLPGKLFHQPDLKGLFFSYAEVAFWLAEAKERGYSVGSSSAETYYNQAVAASLDYWGVSSSTATYLANPKVAYTTAEGTYKQKIGIQKWIALYSLPNAAWTEIRRLDFPKLNMPNKPYNNVTSYPTRLTYPFVEQTTNATNYTSAVSKLSGGDKITTKLFWDAN